MVRSIFWRSIPFLAITVGGAVALVGFQSVRYEFRKSKQAVKACENIKNKLRESGVQVRDRIDIDQILREVEERNFKEWKNIRGPRPTEDNSEYNIAKKLRKEAREIERKFKLEKKALIKVNAPGGVDNMSGGDSNDSIELSQHFQPPPPPHPPTLSTLPDISSTWSVDAAQGSSCDTGYSSTVHEISDPTTHVSSSEESPGGSSMTETTFSFRLTSDFPLGVPHQSLSPALPECIGGHPVDPDIREEDLVDRNMLNEILEIGFEEQIAILALVKTKGDPRGIDAAVNWILEHSNDDEFDLESGTMGGSFSSLAEVRPHKMVFVANMSLKMGAGKLAAQVGHAAIGMYRSAQRTTEGQRAIESWRTCGEMKIVLKGQDTEHLLDLFKSARDAGLFAHVVSDAGRTQVPAGSRTVLCVFGLSDLVDSITGQLKLL